MQWAILLPFSFRFRLPKQRGPRLSGGPFVHLPDLFGPTRYFAQVLDARAGFDHRTDETDRHLRISVPSLKSSANSSFVK